MENKEGSLSKCQSVISPPDLSRPTLVETCNPIFSLGLYSRGTLILKYFDKTGIIKGFFSHLVSLYRSAALILSVPVSEGKDAGEIFPCQG